jgi:hypothetical protein
MQTKVSFVYDEYFRKWEVFVTGVKNNLEARQAFNAVVITCEDAIPKVDSNRAEQLEDGSYKISIGV